MLSVSHSPMTSGFCWTFFSRSIRKVKDVLSEFTFRCHILMVYSGGSLSSFRKLSSVVCFRGRVYLKKLNVISFYSRRCLWRFLSAFSFFLCAFFLFCTYSQFLAVCPTSPQSSHFCRPRCQIGISCPATLMAPGRLSACSRDSHLMYIVNPP